MKELYLLLGCICLVVGIMVIPGRLLLGKSIDSMDIAITVFVLSMGLFDIILSFKEPD